MQVQVNGENMTVDDSINLNDLLSVAGFAGKRIAVMVNDAIIRRDDRASVTLNEGDRIEIISMVGGG